VLFAFVVLKQNEIYLFYISVHAETINENELNKLNKPNKLNKH